jgi:pseudouridine-5'-phosphate glycosidase
MPAATSVGVAPSIKQAVAARRPVVALESAVITHGLPRDVALTATRKQWEACEKAGVVPAVVAVFDGALRIGLTLDECATLAERRDAAKVSPWNLAASIAHPGFGGTTVAATIVAAALSGIRIVATGGIGGVHPGNGRDVSSDLTELGKRQVCVVCAGPKSTLDAPATLEQLETLGVPVIGWQSSVLAGFLATSAGLRLEARVDTVDELASLVRRHWDLGGAGVVVSQPLASELAIPREQLVAASDEGQEHGPGRTPAELSRLQARLGKVVIDANVALLERNAALAAQVAAALARS